MATTERPESWQAAITAALGLPAEEPLALVLRSLALLQSQRDRYSVALTEHLTAEPLACVGCKGRTGRMEHGEATSYALCADCAIQARDEMIAHLRAEDGAGTDPSSDEDAMVAEALDRWRSTVCLALGLPEMGSLEQVEDALAVLKTRAAVDVVGMQHRLDAAVGREFQAIARAERAEREAAQLRIRADQVPVLEADLQRAHERNEAAERERAERLAERVMENARLRTDLESALARLEEYGRAVGDARAQLDTVPAAEVPAGWPKGWTPDAMSRLPCWRAPRDSDGHHGPSAVVYEVAGGGYEAAMETPYQDTVESALELLRRMAWGLAGRPLPEPALTAEEAARVLAESAARMSQIRARRDEWDEPATLPPDPLAIYRPWKGSADELAAQLNALEPADLEHVRLGFTVASGARLVERLTVAIRRGGR